MLIYLVGMSGSGKTTWGKALAKALDFAFIDTDELIEKRSEKTVTELFKKGEAFFREEETKALKSITSYTNTVVATGGGLPCSPENRAIIKATGLSFYLERSISDLEKQLKGETLDRPLLAQSTISLKEKIEQQFKERSLFYEQADFIVKQAEIHLIPLVKQVLKVEA